MQLSTIEYLTRISPGLLQGKFPTPCPLTAQRAIAMLYILQDNQWHTSKAIATPNNFALKHFSLGFAVVSMI